MSMANGIFWQPIRERVLLGDPSAFETVVAENQQVVAGVAYSMVGDFAAAQDISQETFLTAWKSREQLRDPSRLNKLPRHWRTATIRLANG